MILDVLFPKYCFFCFKEGDYFCRQCQEKENGVGGIFFPPHQKELTGIIFSSDFQNPYLRELIHHFKYNGIFDLKELLAARLVEAWKDKSYLEGAILVPVPLHRKRERERGFNQSALLGMILARILGLKFHSILVRVKDTRSQIELKKSERALNVKSAFALKPGYEERVKDATIILVDDVITTGSTLLEAAKVLKRNGAREVWGLVLAKD